MELGGKEAKRSVSVDAFRWDGEPGVLTPSHQIAQVSWPVTLNSQVHEQPGERVLHLPLKRDAEIFQASDSTLGFHRKSL